jgi:SAM-dependent methyltransferase
MSEDPERNLTAQGFIQRFIRKSSAQQQNVRILNAGCGQDLSIGTEFIDLYPCDERVKRWNADWEPIPFADESMDVVYSKCLLEHLGNPRFALTEMARVLRKGGKLRLTTDNGRYWRWVVGFGGAHHFSPTVSFLGKFGWSDFLGELRIDPK